MERVRVTRFRRGVATSQVFPWAWLAVNQFRATADLAGHIVASLAFYRRADIRVGDLCRLSDGRLFVVQQINLDVSQIKCACGEVAPVIPDQFSEGIINPWWTKAVPGTWAVVPSESRLRLTPPTGDSPDDGGFLSQLVTGDFDVCAWVSVAPGTAGDVQRGSLGARVSLTSAVYVGVKDDGTRKIMRMDQSGVSVVESSIAFTGHWLRLKRVGQDFFTYYSGNPRGVETVKDWVLLPPSGATVTSIASVSVGMGGVASGAGSPIVFDEVRNVGR